MMLENQFFQGVFERVTSASFDIDVSQEENPELYRDNLKGELIRLGFDVLGPINESRIAGQRIYSFNVRRRENA